MHTPVFKNASNFKVHIMVQSIAGRYEYKVTSIAGLSINGWRAFITNNNKTVKAQVTVKEITNLYLVDKRIGKNIITYPIIIPIHATGNQKNVFVYVAQVKSKRHIEKYVVTVNQKSFFSLKR